MIQCKGSHTHRVDVLDSEPGNSFSAHKPTTDVKILSVPWLLLRAEG